MKFLLNNKLLTAIAVATMVFVSGCERHGVDFSEPLVVEITGGDFQWDFRYPGPDRRQGTADDIHAQQDLHLPANTQIRLELKSIDYIYSFSLPHLGVKDVAVPELLFAPEFKTTSTGVYELLGDQFCGYSHESLLGRLIIESPEDFRRWLASMKN